jgi:hypothetical protein
MQNFEMAVFLLKEAYITSNKNWISYESGRTLYFCDFTKFRSDFKFAKKIQFVKHSSFFY